MTPAAERPMTERQIQFARMIRDFTEDAGYAPSIRDLAEIFSIKSTNGVNDVLKAMELRGCVVRDRKVARSLRLTSKGLAEIGMAP